MTFADDLLAGPRGQRLLLEFALASDKLTDPRMSEHSLGTAVFDASYHLDPDKERIGFVTRVDAQEAASSPIRGHVGPETVAERIAALILTEPAPELLRQVLQKSVEWAMYWQPPSGTDALAATDPVLTQLRRVAEHLAAAPATAWWSQSMPLTEQWCVRWDEHGVDFRFPPMGRTLRAWREDIQQRELRLAGSGQEHNGDWWSIPPSPICVSTRELPDGTPAGLHGVEDTYGWDKGWAQRLAPPAEARIFEVTGAEAWAELCDRFPMEVTAQNWSQWWETVDNFPDNERLLQATYPNPPYRQVFPHRIAFGRSTAKLIGALDQPSPGMFLITDLVVLCYQPVPDHRQLNRRLEVHR